jgi:hypothetical protein
MKERKMSHEVPRVNRTVKRIEYITLDDEHVLVIAYGVGKEPVKTVVEVGPSEETEAEEAALEPSLD